MKGLNVNVLAIDDHKSVLEVYEIIFKNISKFGSVQFRGESDCQSAHRAIAENMENPFNIAIVDYNLPKWEEKELYSGYDVALYLRKQMPQCKIVFVTMQKEEDIVRQIIENVDPEGFVHKIDCGMAELIEGFTQVLEDDKFYSKSVAQYALQHEQRSCTPS